ncbi:30S ribosome-binding factor RbfA [bacterium]|nr:30S ribosome-binding factor RbfA [bacterium]
MIPNRIQRVNSLIKEEVSKILLKEIDFPKEVLVTVTRVETSIDLREAKIYISVIPKEKVKKVFRTLNIHIYSIQQKLNRRLTMKVVPRIRFIEEKKTAEAARVEELLEKIKNEF